METAAKRISLVTARQQEYPAMSAANLSRSLSVCVGYWQVELTYPLNQHIDEVGQDEAGQHKSWVQTLNHFYTPATTTIASICCVYVHTQTQTHTRTLT